MAPEADRSEGQPLPPSAAPPPDLVEFYQAADQALADLDAWGQDKAQALGAGWGPSSPREGSQQR